MNDYYYNKFRKECILRNYSEQTCKIYTQNINKFLEWTGGKSIENLSLDDARNYIYELRINRQMSTQHCNGTHSALRFFFKYVLHKIWDQDYVPRMANDIKLPRVISLESVEKMINTATETRNKAIISLLYSSGLRVGELCRLKPEDIYMSTMQVYIRSGKNHSDHWTILSQHTLELLIKYWKEYPVQREYLFLTLRKPHTPLKKNAVEAMITKIGNEAGIPAMTPHVLRHSFASHMVEKGVPLEYIQTMMGHRSPSSTHRYIHVSNKALMGIQSPLDHKRGACNV